jgi:tRNA-dihydrouridine synthase A
MTQLNPWIGKSISIAPMLKVTTPHYLKLLSILSKHIQLYSEMTIARSIIENTHVPCFALEPVQNTVALQLAGNNPSELHKAVSIANRQPSYNEYNLNVGCPSKRAGAGLFGVALMEHPQTVALCLRAMKDATHRKVSLKCRLGINVDDNGQSLRKLIDAVLKLNACDTLILHSRIAITKFKPKDNWTIPPLNYETTFKIKQEYPELPVIINGGISSLQQAQNYIHKVDGIMIGRAFENQPALVSLVDKTLHPQIHSTINIPDAVSQYLKYAEHVISSQPHTHPHGLFLPLMHLFHNQKNARSWRIAVGNALKKQNSSLQDSLNEIKKALEERKHLPLSLSENFSHAKREHQHPSPVTTPPDSLKPSTPAKP